MNVESLRHYCLSLPFVTEDMPFDDTTLVFRVAHKIFALLSLDAEPGQVNLKCDPDRAVQLRETHAAVRPGYHMNKKHWNTVVFEDTLSDAFIQELVRHSYELVRSKLSKKEKEIYGIQ